MPCGCPSKLFIYTVSSTALALSLIHAQNIETIESKAVFTCIIEFGYRFSISFHHFLLFLSIISYYYIIIICTYQISHLLHLLLYFDLVVSFSFQFLALVNMVHMKAEIPSPYILTLAANFCISFCPFFWVSTGMSYAFSCAYLCLNV